MGGDGVFRVVRMTSVKGWVGFEPATGFCYDGTQKRLAFCLLMAHDTREAFASNA
jgi:hypothetical protein